MELTVFEEPEKYRTKTKENAEFLHFGMSSQWHELGMENGWLYSSSAEEDWGPFMVCEPSTSEHVMNFMYTKKVKRLGHKTEKCYLIII